MLLLALLFGALLTTSSLAQNDCPGYTASNVQQSSTGLTADLQLAGPACNIYGTDLPNLTLTVEYQACKCSELDLRRHH
jgi:N-terminal barrel of NtMGAM and CtMGAM, maltase-glucoamylase